MFPSLIEMSGVRCCQVTADKGVAGASTRTEGMFSGKEYQMQVIDWGKTIPPLGGSLPRIWGTLMHIGNFEGGGGGGQRRLDSIPLPQGRMFG